VVLWPDRPPAAAGNLVTAKITELRREGLATRVVLNGPLALEASIDSRSDLGNLSIGERVIVRLSPERLRLFRWDSDTSV